MKLFDLINTSRFPIRLQLMTKEGKEICICDSTSITADHYRDCELIDWFYSYTDAHIFRVSIHAE